MGSQPFTKNQRLAAALLFLAIFPLWKWCAHLVVHELGAGAGLVLLAAIFAVAYWLDR
jgi:predicted nicotinamide N-methyase